MRYLLVEQWSRGHSPLHSLDSRAKLVSLLFFLAALSTCGARGSQIVGGIFLVLAVFGCLMAKLPLPGVLVRAAVILPFPLTFAAIAYWSGDPSRAAALVIKTYISALFVLILMATTPLPELLDGLRRLKAPPLFVEIVHLLWRYLFVIGEQARYMRLAALARGGGFSFRMAAGAVTVLFARTIQRAEQMHRAMQARGHDRRFPVLRHPRFGAADLVFVSTCFGLALLVRLGVT